MLEDLQIINSMKKEVNFCIMPYMIQRIAGIFYTYLLVILSFFLFCGFSSKKLYDIEKGILQGDFKEVQEIAGSLDEQDIDQYSFNQAQYFLGLTYLYQNQYKHARIIFKKILRNTVDSQMQQKAQLGLVDS